MSEPCLGQIKLFAFGFAPRGWAQCNGQILPINQNQALFSLLGTNYGGNGVTTFALPDLRGRVPIHVSRDFVLGQAGGEEAHTLTLNEIPAHTHQAWGSNDIASSKSPANNVWAKTAVSSYHTQADKQLNAGAVVNVGQNQAHTNMQPYTVLNFCIALQGIYPSRE
ncbi:phage tail protein [Paenibacillus elgii]|uniref:Phage tail protein n=1 Tax=Paenibacillus elgii TaxID=189691 RepID=A0A165Q2X3_9BACL|nr:tail fiber protein [Paenibacillus elgii]KZE73472.1 phage tail protein [Paenibacillus elgii]